MIKDKSDDIAIKESPLFWPARLKDDVLLILDETLIPKKLKFIKVRTVAEAVKVIRQMKTRAFGQFLVVLNAFLLEIKDEKKVSQKTLLKRIEKAANLLNNSRPTFPFSEVTSVVVGWAKTAYDEKKDIKDYVSRHILGYLAGICSRRLNRVREIADLIVDKDRILTHCNVSGELAMAAHICAKQGKQVTYYATETRPYLQGAKLTTWELMRMGADVTLVADNAVGHMMKEKLVTKVIVGSDRSCANGDFANKIGTYQIAVLAKEFEVPFYVLVQPSNKVKRGEDIPIEIRHSDELLKYQNKRYVKTEVKGFYPGFDVVPHKYITEAIAIDVN